MKRIAIVAMLAASASGALVAAQLYRWVDDKGNVEYRDTPPPKEAKKVEERRIKSNTIETSTPSYGTQQASRNFPVTLWAYDCGDPCTQARAHLSRRGVPYTEKDPKPDLAAFEKLTGSTGVPVLFVGSTKLTGYLQSDWDAALDAAGYPATAGPGAKPAAKATAKPPAKAEEKPAPAPEPTATAEPAPPPADNSPGRGRK